MNGAAESRAKNAEGREVKMRRTILLTVLGLIAMFSASAWLLERMRDDVPLEHVTDGDGNDLIPSEAEGLLRR